MNNTVLLYSEKNTGKCTIVAMRFLFEVESFGRGNLYVNFAYRTVYASISRRVMTVN